ncbi:hypothetical protein BH23ACT10_BH23ACT10_35120 [soil metagenome]
MLVFGCLSVGAAGVAAIAEPVLIAVYWMLAGPVGMLITVRMLRRRETAFGLFVDGTSHWLIVVVLGVGVFGMPFVVGPEPGAFQTVWIGLCYLGFAWLERSAPVLGAAVVMIVAGVALAWSQAAQPNAWSALITGVVLLVGGAVVRRRWLAT